MLQNSIKLEPDNNKEKVREVLKPILYPVLVDIIISYYKYSYHWTYTEQKHDSCTYTYVIMGETIVAVDIAPIIKSVGFGTNDNIVIGVELKQIFNDSSRVYLLMQNNMHSIKIIYYDRKTISDLMISDGKISNSEDIFNNIWYIRNNIIYTHNLNEKDMNVDNVYYPYDKHLVKNINVYYDHTRQTPGFFVSRFCSAGSHKKYKIENMYVSKSNDIIISLCTNYSKKMFTLILSDGTKIVVLNRTYRMCILCCDKWTIFCVYRKKESPHNSVLACVNKLDGQTHEQDLQNIYGINCNDDYNILFLVKESDLYIYRAEIYR